VAVIDGLKGFPEAISAVYTDCAIKTCIGIDSYFVSFCNGKERSRAMNQKNLQRLRTAELGSSGGGFEPGALREKRSRIVNAGRASGNKWCPFFALSHGIRQIHYTTNR